MDFVEIIRTAYGMLTGSGEVLVAIGASAILGIISAAIAATTAAVEGGIAAKQAKDARRTEEKNRAEIEAEQRKRENLFNRRYHQDMTDRTEVQAMLREMREQQDAQRGQNEARGAVLGETKEQQLAEQNDLNKSFAEGMAGMTRNASGLKDGYLDQYENSLANYYQQRRDANTRLSQMQQQSSNMAATAASNAMNAAANMGVAAAGAIDNGGVKKAPEAPPVDANDIINAPKNAPVGGGHETRHPSVVFDKNIIGKPLYDNMYLFKKNRPFFG